MGCGRALFSAVIGVWLQFAWLAVAIADNTPIGKAESVVPASTYVRAGAASDLVINAVLQQDDLVRTTQTGSTQIRFLDDTILTVGPNAQIQLDKGIFDGSQARTLSIKLVSGALRFVSGLSDRKSYEIEPPLANIGVRGTVVDVEYDAGRAIVNFVDGSGPICLTGGACGTIAAGESVLAIDSNGFSPATEAEAARLWRRLDSAHLALAKKAGRDPSAASGAAKGITAPPASGTGQPGGNSGGANTGASGNTANNSTGTSSTNVGNV